MLNEIIYSEYFGNTLLQYATCAGLIILGSIFIFLLNRIIKKKEKLIGYVIDRLTGNIIEVKMQKYLTPLLFFIVVYGSIKGMLTLSDRIRQILHIVFIIIITYYGIRLISVIAKNAFTSYLTNREKEVLEIEQKVRGISTFNNIIITVIGIIFIISNLGFDITAVLAGLGIGGIALALASQNIFMDLFNYFVIFFDQPFQIGDFIILDDLRGTVEKIGIKTTRIRSLQGEEIIISNTDLTSKRIHNYKKMEKRRAVFTFRVIYQTSHEKLAAIPGIIKKIIEDTEGTEFDRCHFKEYGDSSLNFETVYYVLSSNYSFYMDVQQIINLTIFKQFKDNGIDFAYPTRTIYMQN